MALCIICKYQGVILKWIALLINKKMTNFINYILIIFCFTSHTKQMQDTIPKSIIKGSGFINADLTFLKGRGKILAISPQFAVVGLGESPYILYATPQFDANALPQKIEKNIHEVNRIIFQATFSVDPGLETVYSQIPDWMNNFKNLKFLKLSHVNLDKLALATSLPIRHLVLNDIQCNNPIKLIEAIKKFNSLKYVVYDQLSSNELKKVLGQLPVSLTVLTELEYKQKKLIQEL